MRSGFYRPSRRDQLRLQRYESASDAGVMALASYDPYFSSVVSLNHYDGTSGATSITDQIAGVTWTLSGGTPSPQLSDAQIRYPLGTSMLMNKSGVAISNSSSSFTFGTGDFTVELSVYIPLGSLTSVQSNLLESVGGTSFALYYSGAASLRFFAAGADRITGGTLVQGAWNDIAYSRVSGVGRAYVGGVQFGSTYADANNYTSTQMRNNVGNIGSGTPNTHYIDEQRITKGVGRYNSSSYTAPTAPWPNG